MKTRKENGEGTIYYSEKKKMWIGQLTNPNILDKNGKPKRKSIYGKTEKIVKNKMKIAKKEISDGILFKEGYTLNSLLTEFIDSQLQQNKIVGTTYIRKMETLKIITSHPLSDMDLTTVRERDIVKFFGSITNYAQSTIDKVYQMTQKGFSIAKYRKIIDEDFFCAESNVFKPVSKKTTKDVKAFTLEQERRFIDALDNEVRSCFYRKKGNDFTVQLLIELYAGLRMGEINALLVDEIDLGEGTIRVNKTVTMTPEGKHILGKTPKTMAGIRTVKMIPVLQSVLEHYIRYDYPLLTKDTTVPNLLFPNQTGPGLITTQQVNSRFRRICEKYDIIENPNQHMLRHTFATRCIESGVNYAVLQKMLGHRSIKTTIDTYCDIFDNVIKKNISAMNEYMSNNSLLLKQNEVIMPQLYQ